MKVLTVIGTRPEAIKMAPIIQEFARFGDDIVSRVCITGQHREMLDDVMEAFQIRPDYDLDIMKASQSPCQVAAEVLARLEPLLNTERPDWVLVQGDTTTTMAASLAAFYAHVRLGHVEAGLRTYDRTQPFPEEGNRRMVTAAADFHFAPTVRARANLLHENIPPERILLSGNTVIDALRLICAQQRGRAAPLTLELPAERRFLVVTSHRRENWGRPLESICQAMSELAIRYQDDLHIVYPVHPNPNVHVPVHRLLAGRSGITLTSPMSYPTFVYLLQRCHLVLTDSGGLQEEAPSLGKPVLVLRERTERPEAIEAGTARLVGTNTSRIVQEVSELLDHSSLYHQMARAKNPYGDGHAARRIVCALMEDSFLGDR